MNKLLITLILTIVSTFPLQAQTITVLAWDQDISQRKLSIAHELKSQPIRGMHHLARTKPIKIPAKSKKLRLIAKDRLSKDGKPLTIPLTIPEDIKKPLLIILPDKDNPIGIKTMIIDDSTKNLDWGSLLFINSTDESLVLNYEEESVTIPNENKPTTVKLGGENRNIGISLNSKEKTELPSYYSAIWKQRNDLRQLVIITPNKNITRAKLNVKFITEYKATEKVTK